MCVKRAVHVAWWWIRPAPDPTTTPPPLVPGATLTNDITRAKQIVKTYYFYLTLWAASIKLAISLADIRPESANVRQRTQRERQPYSAMIARGQGLGQSLGQAMLVAAECMGVKYNQWENAYKLEQAHQNAVVMVVLEICYVFSTFRLVWSYGYILKLASIKRTNVVRWWRGDVVT